MESWVSNIRCNMFRFGTVIGMSLFICCDSAEYYSTGATEITDYFDTTLSVITIDRLYETPDEIQTTESNVETDTTDTQDVTITSQAPYDTTGAPLPMAPPTVSLSGCGTGTRNERDSCTLTCDATGGNPTTIDSYRWQFKPKFGEVFEDLSTAGASHVLNNVSYTDAGRYKCTSINAAGRSADDTRTISVHYAPIADSLDSPATNTFFAALGDDVTLWLAVHSFPNNAAFTWRKDRSNRQDQTQSLPKDYTNSTLLIISVDAGDYGEYTVTVTNGGGRSNIYTVVLEQRGKPGPATDLMIESRSYREIIISFMPGLDGGFVQTISAEIKSDGASAFTNTGQPIIDPMQQVRYEIIADNLDHSSAYEMRLTSDNGHASGSASVSETISVTTRGQVQRPQNMEAELTNGTVELSWSEPRGEYTTVDIEQCNSTHCTRHNVTTLTSIELNEADGTRQITLIVKQDRDEVVSERFKFENKNIVEKDPGTGPGGSQAALIGGAVGGLVAVALIAVVVVVVILRRRADKLRNTPNAPMYENVANSDKQNNNTSPTYEIVEICKETNNEPPMYENRDIGEKKTNRPQQLNDAHLAMEGAAAACSDGDDDYQKVYDVLPRTEDVFNLSSRDLELKDKLGHGNFGDVMQGNFTRNGHVIAVAVKTLKRNDAPNAQSEIIKEAKLMADLRHRNIVRLIGVCQTDTVMLVMELASLGPLSKYLKSHPSMAITNIIELMYQVAEGMAYLESKYFVHRDLAARNVLLVSESFAKISDFGMSKALGCDGNYYKAEHAGKWPLKWYAPECIYLYKFDSKSDIWSYGVTLWEAVAYGDKPYKYLKGQDILEKIERGERLEQPLDCPDGVYDLMYSCWNYDKQERPTFRQLADDLSHFRSPRSKLDNSR